LLSGGATFGKYHFGLLNALYEQDLMPRIISGSSVGSIVCSVLASKPFDKIDEIFDPHEVFKYPILGRLTDNNWQFILDLLQKKVVLDTQTLKDYVYRFTGEMTFKEIFTKNGWNLNITVTDFAMKTAPRLLNYLTTPNVLVWSAVCASCAIPGMYAKVDLMQKLDDGSITQYDPSSKRMQFVDGSVASDLPMQRLTELFNVNTFIVSQVNPHVCPSMWIAARSSTTPSSCALRASCASSWEIQCALACARWPRSASCLGISDRSHTLSIRVTRVT